MALQSKRDAPAVHGVTRFKWFLSRGSDAACGPASEHVFAATQEGGLSTLVEMFQRRMLANVCVYVYVYLVQA